MRKKVKIFTAPTGLLLESNISKWLIENDVDVVSISYEASETFFSALILYINL